MTDAPKITPKDRRPRSYPAPEFPPRQPKAFARTPPAIFPLILGLLALGLAARKGAEVLGLSQSVIGGLVEAALGALLILWLFAIVALKVKVIRRFGVIAEDMRVLPGRAGLAASTMTGMAAALVLVPYAPRLALVLALASLVAHAVMAAILVATLAKMPPEARVVNPAMHLAFVGFILGALPLGQLGYTGSAMALFWITLAIAVLIWAVSGWQLLRTMPPAPLRPLLAIHLAPAALFSRVANEAGHTQLGLGFVILGMVIFLALLASARWLTVSGFSPLWGAFTFPLGAFATALMTQGGTWEAPGLAVLVLALGIIPAIAWNVLKLWPGNRLAVKTNAAEA